MTHLAPVVRADKNGKLVTRHVRTDQAPALRGAVIIPAALPHSPAMEPAAPLPVQDVVTLRPENVTAVTKRLDAANKRLDRAGMPHIEWRVEQREVELDPGQRWGLMEVAEMVDLVIDYPEVKTATHDFVGSMVQEDSGMLTRLREDTDLGEWRPRDSWCDHCGTNRRRNATYVVRDRETGEYAQIGSSCLEGYLGVDPADLWVLSYSPLKDDAERQRLTALPEAPKQRADVRKALAAALVVSENGEHYQKRSRYQDEYSENPEHGDRSTYAAVKAALGETGSESDEAKAYMADIQRRAEERLGDVDQFIADILGSDDSSEYVGNLKVLMSGETCEVRNLGTLVSAVTVYRRMHPEQDGRVNEWLGAKGDKLTGLKAKVERISYADGYYGTKTVVTMRTESGHELTWFATNSPDLGEGDKLEINSATVKDHSEWQGRKQTVVTRTKFEVTEAVPRLRENWD